MKNKQVFIVIGLIILLLVFINFQKEEFASMKVNYYKNGVEVISSFSIISGEYDTFSLSIVGEETEGAPIENLQIIDAGPTEFLNALPTTIQSLNPNERKVLWLSNQMDTSTFELMSQPVTFWVEISNGIITETSSIDLTFHPSSPIAIIYDDFEDGNIDLTLWEKLPRICTFGGCSSYQNWIEESSGYLQEYARMTSSEGGICTIINLFKSEYNLNDGKDYLINFTVSTISTRGRISIYNLINFNEPAFGYGCSINPNTNRNLFYDFPNLNGGTKEYYITLDSSTNNLELYDNFGFIKSIVLDSNDGWYLLFESNQFMAGSQTYVNDLKIYDFEVYLI